MIAFDLALRSERQVATMRPDGSHVQDLTPGVALDEDPSFSPDLRRLAFDSDRGGRRPQIYVLTVRNRRVVRLIRDRFADSDPAWSPRGGAVAFLSRGHDRRGAICVRTLRRPARTRCVAQGAAGGPGWSPDGRTLAFTERSGLYLVAATGGRPRRVAAGAAEGAPSWSPDGKSIAFTRPLDGGDIYVIGRDGSGEHDLTQDPAADVEPSWAPDGTRVAFSSDRGGYDALYAVGRDGGPAALLSPSGLDGANPDWRR